jgi:hypothetical protein
MMNVLSRVADVISGYHFRERLSTTSEGNVSVVQMKDVVDAELVPSLRFVRVQLPPAPGRVSIQDGDVILRARGESYSGVLARGQFDRTVVAAPLMLIRADTRVLLPAYLKWFLNHPATQAQLSELATGTHVRTVSKAELEALPIPVPPLKRQNKIAEIAALAATEQALLGKISASRRRLAEGILWRYAQETR